MALMPDADGPTPSCGSKAVPREASAEGIPELVRLARLLLDTARVEDLADVFQAMCTTPERKWLFGQILLCSPTSAAEQMLALLHREPGSASQLLVKLVADVEGECPLELSESPGAGTRLAGEKAIQGLLSRTLTAAIGELCEERAPDLARMGIQLPLWTASDMARFAGSPGLKEKVRAWFVATLSERLLVLLEGCCIMAQLQDALGPRAVPLTAAQIVAESLATAEVCRECLTHSSHLRESRIFFERIAWPLLEPGPDAAPPHCEERFGCIASGALDVQMRQLEILRPKIRLHSLWRLAAVLLTWRFLADRDKLLAVEGQLRSFLAVPGSLVAWKTDGSPKEIGEAFFLQEVLPFISEEKRVRNESAERSADKAMAELLGTEASSAPASGSAAAKRKAKRGKRPEAAGSGYPALAEQAQAATADAQKQPTATEEKQEALADQAAEKAAVAAWSRLSAQLLMMGGSEHGHK